MGDKKRRLEKLEKAGGGDDEINVSVNWCKSGFMLDENTGEEITYKEWRTRYPDDELIIVSLGEEEDTPTPPQKT